MKRLLSLAVALLCAAPNLALAQDSAPMVIDRIAAERLGASQGPAVRLARAPLEATDEMRDVALPLLRPLSATVSAGYRAGSITPGAELSVIALQEVPLRGVGSARREVARGLRDVVSADIDRATLESAARGALAWVGAVEAIAIVHVRDDAFEQAKTLAETTRKRVDAGAAQPYERALADAELGDAQTAVLDAEGMKVDALAELRFALGLSPQQPVDVRGDLDAEQASPTPTGPSAAPSIELALARSRSAEADEHLSSATLGPWLGVGGEYVREGTGDQIVLGVVSFPIPLFDAARFDATRQRAIADGARAQVDFARASLDRDRFVAAHDREHWRSVRDALKSGSLSATQDALRLARMQYESGLRDVTVVLLARQRLAAVRESLTHAAAEVQRADIRYARAMGTLLAGGARP